VWSSRSKRSSGAILQGCCAFCCRWLVIVVASRTKDHHVPKLARMTCICMAGNWYKSTALGGNSSSYLHKEVSCPSPDISYSQDHGGTRPWRHILYIVLRLHARCYRRLKLGGPRQRTLGGAGTPRDIRYCKGQDRFICLVDVSDTKFDMHYARVRNNAMSDDTPIFVVQDGEDVQEVPATNMAKFPRLIGLPHRVRRTSKREAVRRLWLAVLQTWQVHRISYSTDNKLDPRQTGAAVPCS